MKMGLLLYCSSTLIAISIMCSEINLLPKRIISHFIFIRRKNQCCRWPLHQDLCSICLLIITWRSFVSMEPPVPLKGELKFGQFNFAVVFLVDFRNLFYYFYSNFYI